jgi:hypothetical protein
MSTQVQQYFQRYAPKRPAAGKPVTARQPSKVFARQQVAQQQLQEPVETSGDNKHWWRNFYENCAHLGIFKKEVGDLAIIRGPIFPLISAFKKVLDTGDEDQIIAFLRDQDAEIHAQGYSKHYDSRRRKERFPQQEEAFVNADGSIDWKMAAQLANDIVTDIYIPSKKD